MTASSSRNALRLRAASGAAVALLCLVYAVVLSLGLWTLPSPAHPIQPPWFTAMEVLILAIAPAMVVWTVALHASAPAGRRAFALAGVAFMSMAAAVTCTLHFAILTLARTPPFDTPTWARAVFSFEWPSIAYALDIVAWDLFFPLAATFAAISVEGPGLARVVRVLLLASAALAFAGLGGVLRGDMGVRNLGIVGYAVLFPIAAALLGRLDRRAGPAGEP